jgi:hypothetical protein
LELPDALMSNPDLMARVLQVWQARDEREPDAPLGPDRPELMSALSLTGAGGPAGVTSSHPPEVDGVSQPAGNP